MDFNGFDGKYPLRNNLVLELHVSDFSKVKDFYGKLGFQVLFEEPKTEELGYLVIRMGDTFINFYGGDERVFMHSFFNEFPKETKVGYEVEITIPVKNIEAYYKKIYPDIKDNIAQDLTLKRWGKQDFRLKDPFGFYLRFTEPVDWTK